MSESNLQSGFEVEWVSRLPFDENHEALHDRAVRHFDDFKTYAAAKCYATEKAAESPYGCVQIRQFEMQPDPDYPWLYMREYIGDLIEISA